MPASRAKFLLAAASAAALTFGLSACSVGYVMNAAWTQSSILLNRKAISEVIEENNTLSERERSGLLWVQAARKYAERRGLDCGGSFTSYSPIDTEVLSWVVAAAYPLELKAKTWWFPIVGTVPYKGYFDKAQAIKSMKSLQGEGLQATVRGVTAFSTLGWFDDPVLTPLLSTGAVSIVNTVIHETVHSTVWIPSSVEFNESLAHFIALNETVRFFSSELCLQQCEELEQEARIVRKNEFKYAARLQTLRRNLEKIFQDDSTSETEKIKQKQATYQQTLASEPDSSANPGLASRANNAEFLQDLIYRNYFPCFRKLHDKYPETTAGTFVNEIEQQFIGNKPKEPCLEDLDKAL